MKLLSLFITIIIYLASSSVFAKKQLEYDFNLIDKNEKKITYCNWQDQKICDNAYDC